MIFWYLEKLFFVFLLLFILRDFKYLIKFYFDSRMYEEIFNDYYLIFIIIMILCNN